MSWNRVNFHGRPHKIVDKANAPAATVYKIGDKRNVLPNCHLSPIAARLVRESQNGGSAREMDFNPRDIEQLGHLGFPLVRENGRVAIKDAVRVGDLEPIGVGSQAGVGNQHRNSNDDYVGPMRWGGRS